MILGIVLIIVIDNFDTGCTFNVIIFLKVVIIIHGNFPLSGNVWWTNGRFGLIRDFYYLRLNVMTGSYNVLLLSSRGDLF